jgi:hypothetical protein
MPPRGTVESKLPEHDKLQLALQFLRDNPDEDPRTPARIWKLKKPGTLQKKWKRERKRMEQLKLGMVVQHSGHNKILNTEQERALIQYATNHCLEGRRGATKQMMYNCAMFFRVKEGKEPLLEVVSVLVEEYARTPCD